MPLNFVPPLLNSANPWATTKEDIQSLYDCPFTGALTIRTSVLGGFQHDDRIHQYRFFGHDGESGHYSVLLSSFNGLFWDLGSTIVML